MANRADYTTIELPIMLRDQIARNRLHGRQAYHEVVEEALTFWQDCGGWCLDPPVDIPPSVRRRSR